MKIVDVQPRCFSGSLGPLCPRPSLKLAGVLAQRGDLIARRRDWSRGLHDLRHVGRRAEADRRQSILGDIGWGYGIPYCGTHGTASSNAMLGTRGDGAKKQRVTLLQTYPGWDLRGETQLLLFCILVISSQV